MSPQGGADCVKSASNKKKAKRKLLIKSSVLCHESAADGLFNREIKAVQAEYE